MLRGAGPAPPPSAAGGGHVPAEHDPRGQRGSPAAAPEGRARAPCATYARRANVRRLRGEERADKTCLFHHFHPKSIMPSSPIDLREHLDHGRADPGAARLPRAAGPTMPPRTRIVAPFRPFSACARLHGQQRASGKQRTLSTSSWPWFVLARAPPRRGREELEAQKHAAGGCSACRRASSEVVPRIRAPRAARTRRRIEVGVLLGTAGRPPRRDLAVLCQPPEPLTAAILKFRSWDSSFYCRRRCRLFKRHREARRGPH